MPVDPTTRRYVKSLIEVIGLLREKNPNMSLAQALAFFLVAVNEGASGVELQRASHGLKRSSLSRILIELSVGRSTNDANSGLVDRGGGDADLRTNAYTLTPKGLHLLKEVVEALKTKE